MPPAVPKSNPFYVLLIAVGVAFCLSACLYGVLAFRELRMPHDPPPPESLLGWMARYGDRLLIGELILLTLATAGAIKLDQWRQATAPSPAVDLEGENKP